MRRILYIFCFLSASGLRAQDFHFSQTSETPLLMNPAATGVYNGLFRFQTNHRNQWIGGNTQFMTTSFVADGCLYKKPHQNNAHLGLGLFGYNDIGGDSRFGVKSITASVSGIVPLNDDGHQISVGLQVGFANRTGDLSRVNFENQWNGTAFDQTIGSGEYLNPSFKHLESAAGIMYQFNGDRSTFKQNAENRFQVGVALYHINKPRLDYTMGIQDFLYRKLVFHSSYSSDLASTDWSYDLSLVQFVQGPHFETLVGGMIKNRLQSGTKFTGYYSDAYVGFGLYTRWKDAVIPRIYLDFNGFKIGISYDVTISALRRAAGGGSLEFSLSYTNQNQSSFSRRR